MQSGDIKPLNLILNKVEKNIAIGTCVMVTVPLNSQWVTQHLH